MFGISVAIINIRAVRLSTVDSNTISDVPEIEKKKRASETHLIGFGFENIFITDFYAFLSSS